MREVIKRGVSPSAGTVPACLAAMNTGFACPACTAPLVLRFTAAVDDPSVEIVPRPCPCPNPFCRVELPPRRGNLWLTYALVGTAATAEDEGASSTS